MAGMKGEKRRSLEKEMRWVDDLGTTIFYPALRKFVPVSCAAVVR